MTDTNGATSSTTLTITITGTNDAPVAVADINGADAVTEAGVNPGNTAFAGDAVRHRQRADQRHRRRHRRQQDGVRGHGSAGNVGSAVAGTYGSVTIAADGSYTYTLDNGDPDTHALAQGATASPTASPTR